MSITLTSKDTVKPAFNENNHLIVFALDNNYLIYTSVAIISIIENALEIQNYDIVILEEFLSKENKTILTDLIREKQNFSLRFFNVKELVDESREFFFLNIDTSIAQYYRLFIVKIFYEYERALYLDSDLVIDTDITELMNINFDGNYAAAVPDFMHIHARVHNEKVLDYLTNVLKIQDYTQYFNSGVILFNINAIRNVNFLEESIKILKRVKEVIWHDQDVLNVLFQGKVILLGIQWNYTLDRDGFKNYLQTDLKLDNPQALERARKALTETPSIAHFGGYKKPWLALQTPLSEKFWKYAKKSPFYKDLDAQLMQKLPGLLRKARMERLLYTLLLKLPVGKLRAKYTARRLFYHNGILASERYLKNKDV